MGKLSDAEQQLEFLNEVQSSMGKSPELLFLSALLSWRKRGNREDSIRALDQASPVSPTRPRNPLPLAHLSLQSTLMPEPIPRSTIASRLYH